MNTLQRVDKIIGIDCATDPKRIGLALATFTDERPVVKSLARGNDTPGGPAEIIGNWIEANDKVLLALDAPLGWPAPLGRELSNHRAGQMLEPTADELFQRETDRFVRRAVGRRPLDVGADRIARTAAAALRLLGRLRANLREPIPLAWSPNEKARVSAIEVYPAATLSVCRIQASGYKAPSDRDPRSRILERLTGFIAAPGDPGLAIEQADVLDAIVCALGGVRFLSEKSLCPVDRDLATKEGWIWF